MRIPAETPLQGLDNPTLAVGTSDLSHWSTSLPFIDLMKSQKPAENKGYPVDGLGWPTADDGDRNLSYAFHWQGEALDAYTGRYVLSYDGEADIKVRGGEVVSARTGEVVFDVEDPSYFAFTLKTNDPRGTGDHFRNATLVREEHVDLHEAGAILNPDYVETFADVRELRFMGWSGAGGARPVSLDDVTPLEQASYLGTTYPTEAKVRLANVIGADPWFVVPYGADEAYVRHVAEYVRDHLDPRLVARVEFSNETWNWGFEQAGQLGRDAMADWGADDAASLGGYHAKLAVEHALIWDDAFGAEADTRLSHVLSGQTGHLARAHHRIEAEAWRENEPDAFVDPATVFDAYAVTTYFGGSIGKKIETIEALLAADADPAVDVNAVLHGMLLDPEVPLSLPDRARMMRAEADFVHEKGLDYVLYEGGSHLVSTSNHASVRQILKDFAYTPEMADLYARLWADWQAIGDGPFMQLSEVSPVMDSGAWGLLKARGTTNPVAETVFALNEATPAWWGDRAGAPFRHGITSLGDAGDESVGGTAEEDALTGAAGRDVLYGYGGDDILHGGPGEDTLSGGLGADRLMGGAGADRFVFEADLADDRRETDVVVDYEPGVDTLSLPEDASLSIERGDAGARLVFGPDADVIVLEGVDLEVGGDPTAIGVRFDGVSYAPVIETSEERGPSDPEELVSRDHGEPALPTGALAFEMAPSGGAIAAGTAVPDNSAVNRGTYDEKTHAIAFET
ncbi:MAG: calcium-binding protein, partial [Paracoccaceae bacterium]